MRRPARVRNSAGVHGYVTAPALAWAGWRLRIPGGPEGGQYHGYTGDDSDQAATTLAGPGDAWNPVWGGTSLREGETLSDFIYRSPGEVRPRPNASGGANVLFEYQTKRDAGYAVAPGNYAALGLMPAEEAIVSTHRFLYPPVSVRVPSPPAVVPSPSLGWPAGATEGTICPQFQIACPPGANVVYDSGPCHSPIGCNMVAQPAPISPAPVNTIPITMVPPVSPAPAPTVPAAPEDYLPATGQPLPTGAASVSSGTDIMGWLTESSIWSAVPNWLLVAGGALLLFRGDSHRGRR